MVATAPSPALGAAQTAPALVQAFKDRLTNVRAWLHKDGQSLLDMDVVVVGNGKTPVRTLDGKPQLTAGSDGTLRLAMPSAYRAIALPVYKGDVRQVQALKARHKGTDLDALAVQAAKDAGVQCRWQYQSSGEVHRTCHVNLDDLMGNLLAWRTAPCKKGDGTCVDYSGQKWSLLPAAGRMEPEQRKKRLYDSLALLLEETLRDKIEVVDANASGSMLIRSAFRAPPA